MSDDSKSSHEPESRVYLKRTCWSIWAAAFASCLFGKVEGIARTAPIVVCSILSILLVAVSVSGIILAAVLLLYRKRCTKSESDIDVNDLGHIAAGLTVFQLMAIVIWSLCVRIIKEYVAG